MTKEETNEIVNAVIQIKALDQIPKASRQHVHETEFMTHLNVIRTNQIEFFKSLTQKRFDQCFYQFNFNDGTFNLWGDDCDLMKRIEDQSDIRLPEKDLTDREINDLIIQLENAQTSIYGGLFELKPIQLFYQQVYDWAQSVYKALCLSDKEWEGECTFSLLVPEQFMLNRSYLDMLVQMYEVKLDMFKATYEKLSRMIALRLNEPGELQRGEKEFTGTKFEKRK